MFQDSPHLDSEQALLDEVKRLSEEVKDELQPAAIVRNRMIPPAVQLGGRLLLRWLEDHSDPGDEVINAVCANWAGHFEIRMLGNDTFPKLSAEEREAFYIMMHYGSAFVHQADARLSRSKIGHGMRGLLILNVLTCYPDWTQAKFGELPYDGRLAVEEMTYSLQKDKEAHPDDSKKAGSWAQFDQALKGVIPPAEAATGCRKSVPRRSGASKKNSCFVATAAYSADAEQVRTLRVFRDEVLVASRPGRAFMRAYNTIGPKLARLISGRPFPRFLCRMLLHPVAWAAAVAVRRSRTRAQASSLSRQ